MQLGIIWMRLTRLLYGQIGVYIEPIESRYMHCLKCKKYHDPMKTPCG
jgi:hypothetical protein